MPWLSKVAVVGLVMGLAWVQPSRVAGQTPSKPPTAEQVQQLLAAYQRELDESAASFAPELLIPAESAARRARSALEYQRFVEAAQAVREARWLLPIRPPDLPAHVVRVIGNTRLRHANAVTGIAYNPSNAQLASCSRDGTIRFWDLANGRQTRSIYVGQAVRTLAWSPDGSRLAAAVGKEVHVYDPATGKEQFRFRGHSDLVSCLAFHPDGQSLASGSDDGTVRLSDWQGNERLLAPRPGQKQPPIVALAYTPTGQQLLQLDQAGILTVLTPQEPKPAAEPARLTLLAKDKTQGIALALSANGRLLAASLVPGKAHLFELGIDRLEGSVSVRLQRVYTTPGQGLVTALGFDKTGQRLVTSSNDPLAASPDGIVGNVRVWDTLTGKLMQTYRGHTAKIDALAIAPDGSQIASGGQDQNVKLWSLGLTDPHRLLAMQKGEIWCVAVSPDGQLVAAAGSDKQVRIYNYADGKERHVLAGHQGVVNALAFSPQGDWLISGGTDKVVKVWDTKTGNLLRQLPTEQSPVMALAISPDGKQLAAGGADRSVYLWTLATGQLQHRLQGIPAAVTALAYYPSGRCLAVGDAAGGVKLVDAEQGNVLPNLDFKAHVVGVSGLSFNATGTLLASCGGESRIRLYSVAAGPAKAPPTAITSLAELDGHLTPVSAVAFSPDGNSLASGAGDQTVKIWSVSEKTELRTFRGHTDWISGLAFAPDGRTVISVGVDRSVRVWDTRTSESPTPPGHWRAINALSITADSQLLVTGSDDRSVRVWNLTNGVELASPYQHPNAVNAVCISPEGKLIVSASRTTTNPPTDEIKLWDRLTGQLRRIEQTPHQILLVQCTPDGERLTTWQLLRSAKESNSLLTMHRLDPWQSLFSFSEPNRRHTCVGLCADGVHVALGGPDGSVRVWDISNGKQLGQDIAAHRRAVADVGLSPDMSLLFTATSDAEVKIWELQKAQLLHTIQAHDSPLAGLIVGPTGDRFATFDSTGGIKVWDTQAKLLRVWELRMPVATVAFTPDGRHLLSANGDGTVYLLQLP